VAAAVTEAIAAIKAIEAIEAIGAIGTPNLDSLAGERGESGDEQSMVAAAAFDVVAAICHDMRTPVASLRATVEVLEEHRSLAEHEVTTQVERLKRGLTWLDGLVNNLTSWALQRGGRLVLRPARICVADCITQAVAVVEPLLQQRRQAVVVTQPVPCPHAHADADRLTQVLINLLMNASAYGPAEQPIAVHISAVAAAAADQADQVEVRVTDQGDGLAPAERHHIFDQYTRGSAGHRRRHGLGLGLHIVKTFVELHGGAVGVESRPGSGASFWFRLPSSAPDALDAPLDQGERCTDGAESRLTGSRSQAHRRN
jgi:signal transduction histidine kinase